MAERFEAFAQRRNRIDRPSQCRTSAIGAEKYIEFLFVGTANVVVRQPQRFRVKIHAIQPHVEMDASAGRFGGIQQQQVQPAAMHRPDHFAVVLAVTLQVGVAIGEMHHAPAHHHRLVEHRLVQSGLSQCMQAAFGQREVDRASAFVADRTRVGAFLEHLDRPTSAREQGREQRASKASAGDGDGLARLRSHRATQQSHRPVAMRRYNGCTTASARRGSHRVRANRR